MGRLNGAVFLDAGNIWLLKKDPKRPGAELKWKGLLNEIALGTGFGLRYDISYLVIRADLGIGIHTPYPNPDKTGYYNISSFKDGLGFHLAIGYPFWGEGHTDTARAAGYSQPPSPTPVFRPIGNGFPAA